MSMFFFKEKYIENLHSNPIFTLATDLLLEI